MTAWRSRRELRRRARALAPQVAELAHLVADGAAARELTREVTTTLVETAKADAAPATVARAVAAHCSDDRQRSALAAWLHVVREVPVAELATALDVDAAGARRLVERGTGSAPVTSAEGCRGWALVVPRRGRTPDERSAAAGHLSLCRHCRNRLHAHHVLEQRVAGVGTATLGLSVATAVVRGAASANAAAGTAGAMTLPVAVLSTAAALTAGAGALTATLHLGVGAAHRDPVQHGTPPASTAPGSPAGHDAPAAGEQPVATTAPDRSGPATATPTDLPSLPVDGTVVPLPVPVPSVSAPSVPSQPLPLPGVSVPPLPLPTVTVSPPPLVP